MYGVLVLLRLGTHHRKLICSKWLGWIQPCPMAHDNLISDADARDRHQSLLHCINSARATSAKEPQHIAREGCKPPDNLGVGFDDSRSLLTVR